ncbi:MAG: hypothetical protein GXP27_08495, partial [Planctomycetes bacterium]|nr:hypothetical protein [Planctomycetota bacterium]
MNWKPQPGDQIADRYRLNDVIYADESLSLFAADDLAVSSPVLVGVFGQEDSEPFRASDTAEKLLRLQHPNLASLSAIDLWRGRPFAVGERPAGRTLRDVGSLSGMRILMLINDLSAGLDTAFAETSLCHGLVTPDLIVVCDEQTPDERFVTLGFGMRALAGPARLGPPVPNGANFRTLVFCSPEQLRGEPLSRPSDVYSAGAVLYWLFTGHPPFSADLGSTAELLQSVASRPVPRFREFVSEEAVNPVVESLVLRCLSKQPQGRPTSVREIAEILEEELRIDVPRAAVAPNHQSMTESGDRSGESERMPPRAEPESVEAAISDSPQTDGPNTPARDAE